MIRRETGRDWLIISQQEHARLAENLAAAWTSGPFSDAHARREFLAAVLHHDDGWQAQDLRPLFDAEEGRPREFTEMPMSVSTGIWRESIAAAANFGAMPALWVSRHFGDLAERARPHRPSLEDQAAIERFLAEQSVLRAGQRDFAEARGADIASREETGFLWLQYFDRLSLWFCCQERDSPWTHFTPDRLNLLIEPFSGGRFRCLPNPFFTGRLSVQISGRRIRAERYSSAESFQAALDAADIVSLQWMLGDV